MSAERVFELARHLTERDREVARRVYDQQVLTTDQMQLLFFSSQRRAQDRLLFLYRHRVVDRFYPPSPFGVGKPQAHWLLDEGGAILVTGILGVERKRLGWQRRDDWASHPQLLHRLEANRFVTDLIAATLAKPTLGVTAWYSSRDAAARLNEEMQALLWPDAGFLLDSAEGPIECCLEWDRGTETQARLTEKLHHYRLVEGRLPGDQREPRSVLFVVPAAGRVETLRRAYAAFEPEREWHRRQPGLVDLDGRWLLLAATVPDLGRQGPLGGVWQPIDNASERRRALPELPLRRDLGPADIELALGRRWRKDQPDFWERLSPLHRRPEHEPATVARPAAARPPAQPDDRSVPRPAGHGADPDTPDLADDAETEAFLERLRRRREAELEEMRRDLEAARTARRWAAGEADLRPSGIDGLMLDPGDDVEEEQWR